MNTDYFNTPNWNISPLPVVDPITGSITGGIRKFVDSMPGFGYANRNNLGQYIPVAQKSTTIPYPSSDYYEIGLREYTQKLHTDLPVTNLRGYYDMSPAAAASSVGGVTDSSNHYLGPLIIARKGTPVRVKFTNNLTANSHLLIPTDTTVMGAGMAPDGTMYAETRSNIHLHGGDTIWISDGTPHQWITPVGEITNYHKGDSFSNVPDMVGVGKSIPLPSPTDGLATYYYTNDISSRLMFYHDHTYGTTRLNVYSGAAGYLITDQVEDDIILGTNISGANPSLSRLLPNLGSVYQYGIPLIIQDKSFVDTNRIASTDPTWIWGTTPASNGNLWFPHVYMPNQNPNDPSGANSYGRWDYGPWFWPPVTAAAGLIHGEIVDPVAEIISFFISCHLAVFCSTCGIDLIFSINVDNII